MVSGNSLAFTVGGKHAFDVSIPDVAQTQMQGKNEVVLEFHVDDTTGANEVGCQSRVFIKLFCIFAEQHCLMEIYGPWQALMLRNFSVWKFLGEAAIPWHDTEKKGPLWRVWSLESQRFHYPLSAVEHCWVNLPCWHPLTADLFMSSNPGEVGWSGSYIVVICVLNSIETGGQFQHIFISGCTGLLRNCDFAGFCRKIHWWS